MTDERTDGGTTVDATAREDRAATAKGTPEIGGSLGRRSRQVAALAASEIRLGMRRHWPVVLVVLFAAFGLLLLTFAGSAPGPAGLDRTVASLATLSVYLVPLAALAYGYSTIVGPAERGWLESVAALPIARSTIVLGTVAGRAVVLAGGILVGLAIPGVVLVGEFGSVAWPPYAAVVLAATGLGLAFLGIATLCSALVREKTHALGAALLAWVWFVLVHDLLGLGVVAAFDLPTGAVGAIVLANPASTYRVLVLDVLGASGGGGFEAVGAAAGLSPGLLAVALAGWAILPALAAVLTFGAWGR